MQYYKNFVFIICTVVLGISGYGCSTAKKSSEVDQTPETPHAEDKNLKLDPSTYYDKSYGADAKPESGLGDSDSGHGMGLKTVFFPYDSNVFDAEAKSVLNHNIAILKEHPSLTLQIEGHCDQRGSIQYNLGLGERRAEAIRNYLQRHGISHDRLSVISLGKEKLLDEGMSDDAHAKNRRGNFVLLSQ